jgi:nuclear GTP-binding protein
VTLELNGMTIVFIDTPGLTWQLSEETAPEERKRRRAKDVLLRNRGRIDRLKDPLPAVSYIVSRAETEDLMVFYSIPAFAKGDVDAFLMGVARAQGLIKKVSQVLTAFPSLTTSLISFSPFFVPSQGGKLDLAAAARTVLRDWSTGKLSRYAVPPAAPGPVPTDSTDAVFSSLETIYEGDATLLERLPPRKEMRRSRDLVRLSSERVDNRALALDEPWFGADGQSDEDIDEDVSEAEAEEIGSAAADGSDSEEEDVDGDAELDVGSAEEDEDEDEMPHSSSARKRKRPPPPPPPPSSLAPSSKAPSSKLQSSPARPRKKVAFATSVKATTNSTRSRHGPSATKPSPSKTSNAKVPARTKPPLTAPSRTRKSAANAPLQTAQKRKAAAGGEGEGDAYDFSKFF